jgi:hypothetical protein
MRFLEIAHALDRAKQPLGAMWAYEVAIARAEADLQAYLDLTALYFVANDPGFFSEHRLDKAVVDAAYPRALEVLRLARQQFGDLSEIRFWELQLRELVLGEEISPDAYRELAASSTSLLPHLMLFVASGRREFAEEIASLFRDTRPDTERGRYILSFARSKT